MNRRSSILAFVLVVSCAVAHAADFEDALRLSMPDLEAHARHSILRSGFIPHETPIEVPAVGGCQAGPLSASKDTGSFPCESLPPLPDPPSPSAAAASCTHRQKALFGPFLVLVTNSAIYADAAALPPLLGALPPETADPLRAQWGEIESAKSALSSEGEDLDNKGTRLENDRKRLEAWLARIKTRSRLIDEEVARYNGACAGREQSSECVAWRRRGIQCVEKHNAEVGRYNLLANDWNARRAEIISLGSAFRSKVKSWEDAQIAPFAQAASKALEEVGRSTVRLQAQGTDVPDKNPVIVIDQMRPVCLSQGLAGLAELNQQLTTRQQGARNIAFQDTATYMRRAAAGGGLSGVTKKTFNNPGVDPKEARVDVEVLRGRAFVDCSVMTREWSEAP